MSYERLRNAKRTVVGAKQTMKAVQRNEAKTVFLAENAERRITDPIRQACEEKNIPVELVDSMKKLGRACGIEVGCSAAALLEE